MKLFASSTDAAWKEIEPASGEGNPPRGSLSARDQLDRTLRTVLLSDNLVVLCGLGTSLCIRDDQGTRLAPTMGDLWQEAAALPGFESVRRKVGYQTPETGDNIELFLSRCQLYQSLTKDQETEEFVRQAAVLIARRCSFVAEEVPLPFHTTFLRKIARRPTRQTRTKLFTTNYDTCFETAAAQARFLVVDGFSYSQPPEFDGGFFHYDFVRRAPGREVPEYIPNVFHLYKLHGSVQWTRSHGKVTKRERPDEPLLIYPQHSKFEQSYSQPFLELMSRFQAELRQENTGLLVIGFGFNDLHIAEPILSAIRSNISLNAVIVDPNVEASANSSIREIRSLIAAGDLRVHLLNATFEELVPALPDLVAPTEEERHWSRLAELRREP